MATVVTTHEQLEQALANPQQVVLLLSGNGPGMSDIVDSADKAILLPAAQVAVWVKGVGIYTNEERTKYRPGDPDFLACSLALPPRIVCAYVSRSKALALFFMEAIEAAETREDPPVVLK
jgi:hypothetical protein